MRACFAVNKAKSIAWGLATLTRFRAVEGWQVHRDWTFPFKTRLPSCPRQPSCSPAVSPSGSSQTQGPCDPTGRRVAGERLLELIQTLGRSAAREAQEGRDSDGVAEAVESFVKEFGSRLGDMLDAGAVRVEETAQEDSLERLRESHKALAPTWASATAQMAVVKDRLASLRCEKGPENEE